MTDIPGPGKYEGNASLSLAEYLRDISMELGVDENYGFVDEGGWFGIMRNLDKPTIEQHLRDAYGTEPDVNWHYIISEDNYGFFTYRGYDDLDEVNMAWEEITNG